MSTGQRRSKRLANHQAELEIVSESLNPIALQQKASAKKTGGSSKITKSTTKKTKVEKSTKASSAALAENIRASRAKTHMENPVVIEEELEVGDVFPKDITIINQDDKSIDLSDVIQKNHIVVIFAYPKASTPGCTRQAKGFRDLYKKLNGEFGAVVFGLSADSPKSQTTFKTKQDLPYDLISDTNKILIDLFGIKKHPSGIIRSHLIFVDGVLKVKKVKIGPEDSFNSALTDVERFH